MSVPEKSVQLWLNEARFDWVTGKVTIIDNTRKQGEEGHSAIFKPPYAEKIKLLGLVKIPIQVPNTQTVPRFGFVAEDRYYRYQLSIQRHPNGVGQIFTKKIPK